MFPHATSPRVLLQLLAQVGAGHRRHRALAEVLRIEAPILRAYLAAAVWLGLLTVDEEPALTPAGLRVLYAGRNRAASYADALAAHPTLGPILAAPVLDPAALERLVAEPGLSPRALRRRARALHRLLGPALRPRPPVAVPPPPDATEAAVAAPARPPEQLALGLPPPPPAPAAALDLRAGTDDSPDVYTVVLRALLDHGELEPHQLRGLLDASGGGDCGIGGYLAMATRRGDAVRVGDVLVVTAGACARRDLVESPVSVALSDPDFRAHLAELSAGRPGQARFRAWTRRLFPSGTLEENLDRLLFGRSLASFPVAGDPGEPIPACTDPFLSVVDRKGLALALPSSLALVAGGVAAVNQVLRGARMGASARPPTALDRRVRVHGGLVHPGEGPVRAVPDGVSLRARALRNTPAFAILAALGLLDRRGILRLRAYGQELLVVPTGGRPRRVDAVVEALCQARGWVLARSPTGPSWLALAALAEALGLFTSVPPCFTLEEGLFRKLGTDPEHRDLMEGLEPLAEHLAARVGKR